LTDTRKTRESQLVATEYPYSLDAMNDNHSAQVIQVETTKLTPLLVALSALAMLVAGVSLGVGFWALSYADKARMEARILQVKVEGFENALHAQGIDPDPHLKGQSK
jgi:hypothetical protein